MVSFAGQPPGLDDFSAEVTVMDRQGVRLMFCFGGDEEAEEVVAGGRDVGSRSGCCFLEMCGIYRGRAFDGAGDPRMELSRRSGVSKGGNS